MAKTGSDDMPTVGIGMHYDELEIGQKFKTLGRTITDADITAFVGATGSTEVLFTNLEYLKNETNFDGRLVPGALVYCMAEGLLMQATMQTTGMAFLGMELNIEGPCLAGDTIHVEVEVTEVRKTSKGNRGIVRTRNVVKKHTGETLLVYTPLRMMKGRE